MQHGAALAIPGRGDGARKAAGGLAPACGPGMSPPREPCPRCQDWNPGGSLGRRGGGVDLGVLPAAVRTKPKMVVRGVGVLVTVCFYGIAGAHR